MLIQITSSSYPLIINGYDGVIIMWKFTPQWKILENVFCNRYRSLGGSKWIYRCCSLSSGRSVFYRNRLSLPRGIEHPWSNRLEPVPCRLLVKHVEDFSLNFDWIEQNLGCSVYGPHRPIFVSVVLRGNRLWFWTWNSHIDRRTSDRLNCVSWHRVMAINETSFFIFKLYLSTLLAIFFLLVIVTLCCCASSIRKYLVSCFDLFYRTPPTHTIQNIY